MGMGRALVFWFRSRERERSGQVPFLLTEHVALLIEFLDSLT